MTEGLWHQLGKRVATLGEGAKGSHIGARMGHTWATHGMHARAMHMGHMHSHAHNSHMHKAHARTTTAHMHRVRAQEREAF